MSNVAVSVGSCKNGEEKGDIQLSVPSLPPDSVLLRSKQRSVEEEMERVHTGSLPPVIDFRHKRSLSPPSSRFIASLSAATGSACSSTHSSTTTLNRLKVSTWSLNPSSSLASSSLRSLGRSSSTEGRNEMARNGRRKNALVLNELASKSLYDLAVKFETLAARRSQYNQKSATHLPAL